MSKEKPCINTLLKKISGAEQRATTLAEKLKILKEMISKPEEECPDVVESDKAVVKAIEQLYVQELLTRDPEGDA